MAMLDFKRVIGFHEAALSGILTRQRVIAHNLANQSTPGYRAKTVRFEAIMKNALRSGRADRRLQFPVETDENLPVRADGNSVDLEYELMQMDKNRALHDVFVRAAGSALHGMVTAIRGQ